jgi:predicted MPP superfamily phosphohydrolase
MFLEPRRLRVKRLRVPVSQAASHLTGVKLAHFSDLHFGARGWRKATIEAAIEAVNREAVHLVAITGDFVSSKAGVCPALDVLGGLRRDVPRYAVLGNHDHVYGTRPLDWLNRGLEEAGITVLDNDADLIEVQGGRLWVAGVDDGYSQRDDLGRVLVLLRKTPAPAILLTHYAEVANRLRPGQVQLSLAGHSHGGQIRLPVVAGMVHRHHARTRYGKGLFFVNRNPLFVTSGVGTSGVPLRFLNPPEVAVITFVCGSSPSGGIARQRGR